jgi:hypothetical protein
MFFGRLAGWSPIGKRFETYEGPDTNAWRPPATGKLLSLKPDTRITYQEHSYDTAKTGRNPT